MGWLSVILALPVILIVGSLFNALVDAGNINDPAAQSTVIRNYGLVLAAMIGVPFVIWRSIIAQKQVDVAEQGQITDRINKAVEGLGAEKTVKRQRENSKGKLIYGKSDGEVDYAQPVYEEQTLPNLEVRVGAIYALERIAQDSDRDHIQIMEILCAYIRENAPTEIAEPVPSEPDQKPDTDEVRTWARELKGPRTDIRVALEVIGRRSKNQIALERAAEVRGSTVGYRLDLRHTCLQGADLSELDFENSLLSGVQMQGADLLEAQMQGANLWEAQMDEETSLTAATLRGAAVREVNYNTVPFSQKQVDEMFGDGSVKLPPTLTRPDWPPEVLDYQDFQTQWRVWQAKIGYDPNEDTP